MKNDNPSLKISCDSISTPQVYIVGPLLASIIGAFSYELIFSYPLKEWLDEKVIEMDGPTKHQASPPKEVIVDTNTYDVVVENPVTKYNGEIAYE